MNNKTIYNPASPTDNLKVKEVPGAIRKKGEELYNYIGDLESERVKNNFENINENLNVVYLLNNAEVNSGIYIKHEDQWLGINTIEKLPILNEIENGKRITIGKNSYQFKQINNHNIWTLSNSFKPLMYYDFFQNNAILKNEGILSEEFSLTLNGNQKQDQKLPFVTSSKLFKCRTNVAHHFNNTFSFSCCFKNISRNFEDDIINESNFATLMFLKDKFDVVRIGLVYDKDNHLFFSNRDKTTDLNFVLSENNFYQIAMVHINNKIKVYINSNQIFETEINVLSDKDFYFSVCEDNDYSHFSNGSATFGELNIFDIAITPEENNILKNQPRSWSHQFVPNYLDLTFEEKLKLKSLVKNIELF